MGNAVDHTSQVSADERQPWGRMAQRDRFVDIRARIPAVAPLIIDGGAHAGTTIDLFLTQYPSPRIVGFEPNPEFAQMLKRKYRSRRNVEIHEKALGAVRGRVPFHILNYPASSSLLQPSSINHRYHGEKMDVRETVEVEEVPLDELFTGQAIDLLKLDLQGYELEALKGAERILAQVKVLTTEVEFVSLYEGQAVFREIDGFVAGHGFRLLNLYDLYTHPDGQLTAGDAVYLNDRFF